MHNQHKKWIVRMETIESTNEADDEARMLGCCSRNLSMEMPVFRSIPLLLLSGLILLAVGQALPAQADAEDDDPVRRLLEITQATAMADVAVEQLISLQRQGNPKIPAKFWDELRQEFDASELEPAIAEIWRRHLSEAEIRELVAFYESPLGKKLIAVQPSIVQESIVAGQVWGEATAKRIVERMKAAGHINNL